MSASELFHSRVGQISATGSAFISLWLVEIDSTDDPADVNPLNDSELPAIGSGSTYYPGSIVQHRRIVQRFSTRAFKVAVQYTKPDHLTSSLNLGWEVSVQGGVRSIKILRERRNDRDEHNRLIEPRIIGSNYYKKAEGENPNHETTVYIEGKPKVLSLVQDLNNRRQEGMEVDDSIGTITLKRRFERPVYYHAAFQKLRYVNTDEFFGAPVRTLKFTSINMTPKQANPSEVPGGIINDVSLVFSMKPDTWDETRVHTFKAASGELSTVHKIIGQRPYPIVEETFVGYFGTSFNTLVTAL